jgi:hypothetical protein
VPLETRLLDNSLACGVDGLRLWESQDKADDGHITRCDCFVGELISRMSWPISAHSSARLSGSGKFRSPLDLRGARAQPTGALCTSITTRRHSDDDKA